MQRCLSGHRGEPSIENVCAWWCVCIRAQKLATYREYKEAASTYQQAWSALRKQAFGSWIRNPPDYHQFKWATAVIHSFILDFCLPTCWTGLRFSCGWSGKKTAIYQSGRFLLCQMDGILDTKQTILDWTMLSNSDAGEDSWEPLDSKEIKPVHCKSWIVIGRTDAEAEAPILWPPDAKNGLIRKDPDAGKDWR